MTTANIIVTRTTAITVAPATVWAIIVFSAHVVRPAIRCYALLSLADTSVLTIRCVETAAVTSGSIDVGIHHVVPQLPTYALLHGFCMTVRMTPRRGFNKMAGEIQAKHQPILPIHVDSHGISSESAAIICKTSFAILDSGLQMRQRD